LKKTEKLINLLKQRVIIGDGAMGTVLYHEGAFINTCYDELNVTRPDLIKKIHTAYSDVGADFVETNTFGANSIKLAKYGLRTKVAELNIAGVKLAREAVAEHVLVAAAMGPSGLKLSPKQPEIIRTKLKDMFAEQAKALADAGADFIILETFYNPMELLIAAESVSEVIDLPIIAQMSIDKNHETIFGGKIAPAIAPIAELEQVVAVGLNCSVGPTVMLDAVDELFAATNKAIIIQPNAGVPRTVDGRMFYMATPEYMTEYAKRLFEKGVQIIGGCCGTTPEHIHEISKAILSLSKAQKHRAYHAKTNTSIETNKSLLEKMTPLQEKSALGQKLATGEKVALIELTPPRGTNLKPIIKKAKLCAKYGIDAINIPDGPRASSRLSPMVTATKIQQEADIETILHVCCRDRNIIGVQSDMLGAQAIGLRNMLLITGDPPKLGDYPDATAVFDLDSIALTHVVRDLNCGLDIAQNSFSAPLSLTIGVGVNPVAADLPREIERYHKKVVAGAEYAITQPVYDVDMLLSFLEKTKDCKIPIVAGIWPFTSYKNAEFMANEVPGVIVPKELLKRMSKTTTRAEGLRTGIEIAREMVAAIAKNVSGYAVSAPFGNVKVALAVLGKITIEEALQK